MRQLKRHGCEKSSNWRVYVHEESSNMWASTYCMSYLGLNMGDKQQAATFTTAPVLI